MKTMKTLLIGAISLLIFVNMPPAFGGDGEIKIVAIEPASIRGTPAVHLKWFDDGTSVLVIQAKVPGMAWVDWVYPGFVSGRPKGSPQSLVFSPPKGDIVFFRIVARSD